MDNIKEVENIKLAGTLELEPCYKKNSLTYPTFLQLQQLQKCYFLIFYFKLGLLI